MGNDYIYLFRLRLFEMPQGNLFERINRNKLFEEILSNTKLAVDSYGSRWRFGNPDYVSCSVTLDLAIRAA